VDVSEFLTVCEVYPTDFGLIPRQLAFGLRIFNEHSDLLIMLSFILDA
jgi:hypothetical protein